MQKREKILAIALSTVVVIWFGLPIIENSFLEPLNQLEAEEARLREEQQAKFDEQLDLRKKENQLAVWRKLSLPPDPLDAQRLYQEWLTDLAQLSGLEQMKVTLERRNAQGDVYVTIPVTIEARATMQELAQFLDRFNATELLHRIARCDAISPSSAGNPDLQVTLTAEGISLTSAPVRNRLFPQIQLEAELKKSETTVDLANVPIDFPQETPFRVRMDDEFANVTEVKGTAWTLQRGVDRTFADDHAMGTNIELFPVSPTTAHDAKAVQAMWNQSVFTKPAPQASYDPKLATTIAPPAIRGRRWEWKLDVNSWNPAFGSPMFSLVEGTEQIKLDERSGRLSWDVDAEAEVGARTLQVMVWGSASKQAGFTSTVNLKVRDPNEPPMITQNAPLRFFLGRNSQKRIAATDPDGEDADLRYELEGAPEGMLINEREGLLSWAPPESMDAQTLEVRVTVRDSDEFPESTSRTIPISLEEDSARYTYLTTTFKKTFDGEREEWEAYLFDRATNQTKMLKEATQFTISDFEMTVKEIGEGFVDVERPEGRYRIVFERPLVDMVPLPTPPESSSPATELTPEPVNNSTTPSPENDVQERLENSPVQE